MDILSGQKLRTRRRRLRLTIHEVADYAGMGEATLNRWERNQFPKKLKPEWVERLCEKLDCTLADLMPVSLKHIFDVLIADIDDYIHDPDFDIAGDGVDLRLSRLLRVIVLYKQNPLALGDEDEIELSEAQEVLKQAVDDGLMPIGTEDPAEGV